MLLMGKDPSFMGSLDMRNDELMGTMPVAIFLLYINPSVESDEIQNNC
jgi:hypothetical protein